MKKQKQIKSNWMFCICAAVTASAGWLGLVNTKPVLAAESVGEEMVVSNDAPDIGDSVSLRSPSPDVDVVSGSLYTSSNHQTDGQPEGGRGLPSIDEGELSKNALNTGVDENLGVYDFKDNKTAGTVTVTKVWDDDKTNDEREIPDIKISTEKPSKSALGYTVTFHGDKNAGFVFNDGRDINEVVYNSSGQIVDGVFKVPGGWAAGAVSWFTDKKLKNKVDVSEDGTVQMPLSGDIDLRGKVKTFKNKGGYYRRYSDDIGGNGFNDLIPDTVTEIFFTDEIKPENASVIDVDADGDGGVVAWTENDGATMKVSTQIKGVKVQAAKLSGYMFYDCRGLTALDLSSLDTQNATNMLCMFRGCRGLTALDLSPLNTQKVTNMGGMFYECRGLTALDLSPLDTQNVEYMNNMFYDCRGLTALDLSSLNTQKVTNMHSMFADCSGLTALDLSPLDTQNVTGMDYMFNGCSSLTALDLSTLDTQNVTLMGSMFSGCSGLTALDLSSFNTQNVEEMTFMFEDCSGLTALDLSSFDTQNVTDMRYMFSKCSGLTALDLSPLNTQNVMCMKGMFSGCSGLTALDLSPLNTQNVMGDMSHMFDGCRGLTALDLSPLNTRNVTNMSHMFDGCRGLTALDLSPLNTQIVNNMDYMFSNCSDLTSITTGPKFKFVGIDYRLAGKWQNTAGETFTEGHFPSNVADTYTKIPN